MDVVNADLALAVKTIGLRVENKGGDEYDECYYAMRTLLGAMPLCVFPGCGRVATMDDAGGTLVWCNDHSNNQPCIERALQAMVEEKESGK